jgi:hypothetical protein
MAKTGVINRQIRRENLVRRYAEVRQQLKNEMKKETSFKAKMELHIKLQNW